jgi:hypothetical protein
MVESLGAEKQITRGPGGRILTNTGVWSPDGEWLAYDTRGDAAGDGFNGLTIEAVNVRTGEVRELYRAKNGAYCGVVTFHPRENKVFILGPKTRHLTGNTDLSSPRAIVAADIGEGRPPSARPVSNLDACNITPPFTAGACEAARTHTCGTRRASGELYGEDHTIARFSNRRHQ